MRENTPSRTARLIAVATIFAAAEKIEPAPLPDSVRWCRCFLRDSLSARTLLRMCDCRLGRAVLRAAEFALAPGIVRHFARRKAWIESEWCVARSEGFDRLVTLAAGFDTLGVRCAAPVKGLVNIEIDHPATQAVKRAAIGSETGTHFIAADLAERSVVSLLASGDVPGAGRATLVVAEGLLMYLTADAVERLVRDIASLAVPRLRVVLTFMERHPGQVISFRPRRRLADWWLGRHGEPFTWGATRDEFRHLLADAGMRILAMADEHDLARHWPGYVLEGEILVLAERDGGLIYSPP